MVQKKLPDMEYSFRIFIKKSDAIIKTKKVFDEKVIIAW